MPQFPCFGSRARDARRDFPSLRHLGVPGTPMSFIPNSRTPSVGFRRSSLGEFLFPPPIFPLQLAWDEGEGQPASLPARAGEGGPSYQRHSRPWPVSPPGKADARHANRHLESAGELRAPKAAKPQRGIFPESHFSLPKSPHPLGFRGCPSKRNIPRWQGPPK